jgi:aminoglycoside phosphotransferase (APT) family kinase protein
MSDDTTLLERYLDHRLGDTATLTVDVMRGGGSCEVFALARGAERWVLRRAPRHVSSATAHDVLREFMILDAIKGHEVPIARPVLACADPGIFGAPFYVMERIDGVPIRRRLPRLWASDPDAQGQALEQLIDALVAIHAVDWQSSGLSDLAPRAGNYLERQIRRWVAQLHSYGGRDLPVAVDIAKWLAARRPAAQRPTLCHGDYKLDNVLYSPSPPPNLLAVVDWEMSSIGDPLVDLAWSMIFHPGPQGTIPLGMSSEPTFTPDFVPSVADLVDRYERRSGRSTAHIGWYAVFARWKLAIALEGSYAKFLRGESDKAIHEMFGYQVDALLADAADRIERNATDGGFQ